MKYYAFLSYSHKDIEFSTWLHKRIESYKVSKNIQKISKIGKLYPIFIDKEELRTTANLSASIKKKLQESKFLILISSKNSAASYWVNEEIKYFKMIGRKDNIIILYYEKKSEIYDIRFNEYFFPKSLVNKINSNGNILEENEKIPLFLKFTNNKKDWNKNLLKIISTLLNVDISIIEKRYNRERKNKFIVTIMSLCLFSGLSMIIVNQWGTNKNIKRDLIDSNYEKERKQIMLESAKKRAMLAVEIAADLAKKIPEEKNPPTSMKRDDKIKDIEKMLKVE